MKSDVKGISVTATVEEVTDDMPRVSVFIPKSEDDGSSMKVDPYEHVTINGALPYYIRKGEYVEVPVPVFLQLRNKYPNI